MTMKTLGNLSPAPGSNQAKKRLGRGVGSGLGKTAGRGHKGQKARKSSDVPAGFEGGQVPLYRRLPKRGFFNIFATPVEIVKLSSLQGIPAGTIVDVAELHKRGLISSKEAKVKLLNSGELKASLTLKVHSASKAAKSTVESAGGRLEIIEVPVKVDPRIAKKLAKKKKK